MISGFNTDVRHKGSVYHVQTEDKGRRNPVIESLIYVGGQVVISKRDEYADIIDSEGSDREIAERMDRQHKVMIAAIESGRFDDQLEALLDSGDVLVASNEIGKATDFSRSVDALDVSSPTDSALRRVDRAREIGDQLDDAASLDEVVLQYLDAESSREHLLLALEENGEMQLGQRAFLALRATSSASGDAVDGVEVSVKMISTLHEPEILGEGVTDADGECFLNIQIPALGQGSAALIISATSAIGRAELKHLL